MSNLQICLRPGALGHVHRGNALSSQITLEVLIARHDVCPKW